MQQSCHDARRQALAVGAADADHRDAPAVARCEQVIDDRFADRARLSFGRFEVHEQARARIDLDDRAALLGERTGNILGDQIDTGDVQADDSRGQRNRRGDFRMHLVGHIECHIAVALDQYFGALGRNRIAVVALPFELEASRRIFIQQQHVERKFLAGAAAWIAIDLGVDELAYRRAAIRHQRNRFAARCSRQTAAHHQQAMFVAAHETFDDHFAAFGIGEMIGRLDFLARHQVDGDAAPVIAVARLDHHRHADVFSRFPCILGAVDDAAFRNRHAASAQQTLGQVFIPGDAFGDGAGLVGLRGPYPALAGAIAKLDQIAFGQPYRGNVAVGSRIHDARGARPQAQVIDHLVQAGDRSRHIERFVLHRSQDQITGGMQGGVGHLFVARTHHHLVDPAHSSLARLAEAALHSGQVLQLEGDVLEDVARPGALAQPLQEAAALADTATMFDQRRQPCTSVVRKNREWCWKENLPKYRYPARLP